ncbi:UNVERIFIED_CONTAM: hypothetical protein Sradi_4379100 [Sesamum radiatum]|uniref:Reverse transcriptase domain-containing protein n=1 Tax=Sesamum radiatum TaxID=300843 RepID=A0AAW2NPX6_SESRA
MPFGPGRRINCNILLAQELLQGYNQSHLLPRCTLKVDFTKVYNSMDRDFLWATLEVFGFPTTFISIDYEMCHNSIVLNMSYWKIGEFLIKGQRVEIRRFDVPYLLVLTKEMLHGLGKEKFM